MVSVALSNEEWNVIMRIARRVYPKTRNGCVQVGSCTSDILRLGIFKLWEELQREDPGTPPVGVEQDPGALQDSPFQTLLPQKRWTRGEGRIVRARRRASGRYWDAPKDLYLHPRRKKKPKKEIP